MTEKVFWTDQFQHALEEARRSDLTASSQILALILLSRADQGMNMKSLAKAVGITSAGMTGLRDTLAELGLIEQAYRDDNRKDIILSISMKGLEALAKMLP